ncbi:transcriptional regulator, AraC family [Fibrella aestuarina BUZ 2]|uniref:Transcriptional regulator, AraC family n=1 Tax=Fibrella aestuarina BUZ 2 TaxID=1166018 RepID=I0KBR4_9BACT|nr:AraC family transcriptional regulator [Fibrella aestuarina]CCH01567.1 transcriptional regulator, AraC family [Fibrella aestuarina BUZ 2]
MKRICLIHWLFIFLAFPAMAQQPTQAVLYRFVITEVPANTPHDATLYLTGNFTKWNSAPPDYRFKKQPDGTYQVFMRSDLPRIEYKVTRGDWTSVEGRGNGKVRPNRVLFRNEVSRQPHDVDIHIQSWEDLSGTFEFFSLYDLLLLFSVFQGLLLIITIPSIQNYNRPANRWLVLLLGLTSVLLLMRFVGTNRNVAQAYAKLQLLPDLLLFLYAPIFFIYLRKLLFNTNRPAAGWWRHFLPAVLQVAIYMPFLLTDNKELQLKMVNHDPWLQGVFLGVGLLGLIYNSIYWWLCRRAITAYREHYQMTQSTEHQVHYLNAVLALQAVCLGLWAFFFVLVGIGSAADLDILEIAGTNVDIIWLTFSSIIFLLGYYAIHQPEIFKLPDTQHLPLLEETTEPGQPATELVAEPAGNVPAATPTSKAAASEPTETLLELKQQVDAFMRRHKPYTNPNLTLAELALRMKLPPHVLSKVINEGYQKNFFDFINQLRIDELKTRLNDPRFRSYTLLSMAFEVGFNSKTAFNRSFKKLTNQTPSEYMHTHPSGVTIIDE